MMKQRRCVITGIGVVSPLGNSRAELYAALRDSGCAIRTMEEWGEQDMNSGAFYGAPVVLPDGFVKSLPRAIRRSMSSISLYAASAALQATGEAGLTEADLTSPRTGCIIGSTMGGTTAIAEAFKIVNFGGGVENMSSMQFFKSVSHTAAYNVSHMLNIRGVVQAPCAACASALHSLGLARDLISMGRQDVVICGGAEELAPEVSGSFEVIYAGMSSTRIRDPKLCSRPFDAARGGLVCGEGAGIFVVEELEHALARNAKIYGEIIGYATCGCGTQISQSDAASVVQCFEMLFDDAGVSPDVVDYVNAHATSTVQGDLAEATAIREFFGEGNTPPVSSLKGHFGHTLGASGTLELAAAISMMENNELIPTLNLSEPGEGCHGVDFVMGGVRKKQIDVVLKNSFAFGGINAAVLCKRFNG